MRQIGHHLAGGVAMPTPARFGDVFDPNSGVVQAQVTLGDAALLDAAVVAGQ